MLGWDVNVRLRLGLPARPTTRLWTKTLAEWREIFDREGISWAPVATMDEIFDPHGLDAR